MTTSPTAQFALRLADDALILGQRLCEWSGKAPTLEEDLALSNVALDFLGRARMCYGYAAELTGGNEDQFAFLRDARDFTNLLITELPRGDFAFTMARQYLLDVFEGAYFAALNHSRDQQLSAIAGKVVKEVRYHARRSAHWIEVLGGSTPESQDRLQAAIEELWGYVDELFAMDDLEASLATSGIAVDRKSLESDWHSNVEHHLTANQIKVPDSSWQVSGGRCGVHTEHLGHLLSELQFMQRAYPDLEW